MSSLSRRRLMAAASAGALAAPSLGVSSLVHAQAWPAKQVRVIAPYPPGGGVDTVTRAFTDKIAPKVGATMVVDNQPGAGGTAMT